MSRTNGTRLETAFTTSIEARDGVTTGISAADRARTISVAIDAAKGPEHIVSPGPRLSADRARRRRAGPRRPYRGGGRRRPPRRAQPVGRDLRDHVRGRHDGADGRSVRLRPAPRPADRHDPRPDRLSPAQGPARRADRRGPVREPLGRHLDRQDLPQQGLGRRADRLVKGQVDPGTADPGADARAQHLPRRLRRGRARAAACSKAR